MTMTSTITQFVINSEELKNSVIPYIQITLSDENQIITIKKTYIDNVYLFNDKLIDFNNVNSVWLVNQNIEYRIENNDIYIIEYFEEEEEND